MPLQCHIEQRRAVWSEEGVWNLKGLTEIYLPTPCRVQPHSDGMHCNVRKLVTASATPNYSKYCG